MELIKVNGLIKEFKILKRHEGLKGAIRDLFSKNYTLIKAVDGIDFSIQEGEIVGFVGPNGAGKSTTIKMLTGVLEPGSGEILVNGLIPFTNRKQNASQIGVVFGQRSQLWWDLPVIESFNLLKEIYRIDQLSFESILSDINRLVNIKELYSKPVRILSLGQRMLCDIAASFLHNPRIIFLDEPTIGLDIAVKHKIRELIRELNRKYKTTIILTTHDISDIEALCKRVIIIDKGKIIFDGATEKVKTLTQDYRVLKLSFETKVDAAFTRHFSKFCQQEFPHEEIIPEIQTDGWMHLQVRESGISLPDLLNSLMQYFPVKDIKVEEIETSEVIRKIYEGAL